MIEFKALILNNIRCLTNTVTFQDSLSLIKLEESKVSPKLEHITKKQMRQCSMFVYLINQFLDGFLALQELSQGEAAGAIAIKMGVVWLLCIHNKMLNMTV